VKTRGGGRRAEEGMGGLDFIIWLTAKGVKGTVPKSSYAVKSNDISTLNKYLFII